MKRIVALCLMWAVAWPMAAVEDSQVMYVGGTVPGLTQGTIGRLNTASEALLTFEYPQGKLVIPYAKIESFEYTQPVARHLGVLPAVAVGLFKKRQRRHFFRFSYRDENHTSQAAVFEVPKQMSRTLLAILQTRAPHVCHPEIVCRPWG